MPDHRAAVGTVLVPAQGTGSGVPTPGELFPPLAAGQPQS